MNRLQNCRKRKGDGQTGFIFPFYSMWRHHKIGMVDIGGEWTEKASHPRSKPRKLNQTLCGFSKYVTAVVWRIHVVLLSSWRLHIIDGPGSRTKIRYHGYLLVIVNRKYVIGGAILVEVIHIYISANIKSLDAFIYCRSTDLSKLWHKLVKRKNLWYMRVIFPREWKSIHRMLTYSVDLTTCLKTGPATLARRNLSRAESPICDRWQYKQSFHSHSCRSVHLPF